MSLPSSLSSPEGLCIACLAGPLDASPAWYRIDDYPGVTVQQVQIVRGRPDETQKCATGTMTINGLDTAGVTDPTNATGPFWDSVNGVTYLDPVKQIAFAVWNPVANAWYPRFTGKIATITYTVDPSGKFATFQIDCVDDLDILNDAEVVPGGAGTTVPSGSEGNAYYEQQQVNDRILAAVADASTAVFGQTWPAGLLDIFSGNVIVQASIYSPRAPLLQVIQDAVDAEFPMASNFFVSVSGVLTFRGRYARFNPTDAHYSISHWQLGDDLAFESDSSVAVLRYDGSTYPLVFTRSKDNLINAALCTPQGIAQTDIAGQLVKDTTSISKYAVRSVSYEGLLTESGLETGTPDANTETARFGTYQVDNYKTPQNRPQGLVLKSVAPSSPYASRIWTVLSEIELSDLVTLTTTHPGGGGFPGVDFFVEKISETHVPRGGTAQGDDVTMTLEVSPRAYFNTNPFTGDPPGYS